MKLILLGTGIGDPDPARMSASQALVVGDDIILVDCGPGTTFQVSRAGIDPVGVNHLFFTHHHYDHNSDYAYFVLARSRMVGREHSLQVHGPPGTERLSQALFEEVYGDEIRFRRSRTAEGGGLDLMGLQVSDIDEGFLLERDGWQIRAVRVDHAFIDCALGYRIDSRERSVVISGNTRPSERLVELARGADILVHEVLVPDSSPMWEKLLSRAPLEHWAQRWGHTAPEQVGQVAREAGVGMLVLTHLSSSAYDPMLEEAVRKSYQGKLFIGRDLAIV